MTAARRPYVPPAGAQRVWLIDPAGRATIGWFMITLAKGARALPASITREPSGRDPDWLIITYRRIGEPVERSALEGKAGYAITEDEHAYQVDLWTWGRKNRPAEFDLFKPFDLAHQPSIF